MKGYFDYAATAPPFKESIDVFRETSLLTYGNPSSNHNHGLEARNTLESNKKRFLELLGIEKAALVLTSGGSEANNLVLNSVLKRYPDRKILIARDSHASCYYMTKEHARNVEVVAIDDHGQINTEVLENTLSERYSLVCFLHANNETGIIQHDVDKIIRMCRKRNILLHIDGVQAVGHIPIGINDFSNIFYTFSSHKFGAPRGSGGVITGSPELLTGIIMGGPQENNLRAGTENIAAFAAAVAALDMSLKKMGEIKDTLHKYCHYVKSEIKSRFPQVVFNSNGIGLPGLVSLSIPGIQGSITVTEMAMFGYALSSGSACHSSMKIPSRIIMAMGRDMKTAFGTLRISMGYHTAEEDVCSLTENLVKVINRQLKE